MCKEEVHSSKYTILIIRDCNNGHWNCELDFWHYNVAIDFLQKKPEP